MKNNGYFVKSIVALSLVGTLAMAEGNHESNDFSAKDLGIKSSIQMKKDTSEADERQSAKLGVKDVIGALNSKFSGKITNIKLENIDGNLVYTAEVLGNGDTITNVFVDAGNGKILTSKLDKKDHSDEQEKNQENQHEDNEG
ncbi:MAG: PepSY domain-containing protein [Sulfurospirillaceae bacterium]|nr:PepSY domain-containing protein [Sulfurospirillaceae bacterium]